MKDRPITLINRDGLFVSNEKAVGEDFVETPDPCELQSHHGIDKVVLEKVGFCVEI